MAQPLKIVIASDRTFERLGLRWALQAVADIEIEEMITPGELLQLTTMERVCTNHLTSCLFPIVITNMWDRLTPTGKRIRNRCCVSVQIKISTIVDNRYFFIGAEFQCK